MFVVARPSDGNADPARASGALAERAAARIVAQGDQPCLVVCDVRSLDRPDLAIVDALARLTLVAKRRGAAVRLSGPNPELGSLLSLVGLVVAMGAEGIGGPAAIDGRDRPLRSGRKARR